MDENLKQDIVLILKRMPSYAKLVYKLYKDKDVPKGAKTKLSLALGYNISPVDLIPGFIPVVGQIDNVYFTLRLLRAALKACPEEIASKHLKDTNITLKSIDKDIETSSKAMKEVGKRALKFTGKAISATASATYRLGKGAALFLKRKRNK